MRFVHLTCDDLAEMTAIAKRSLDLDEVDELVIREKTLAARDFDSAMAIAYTKSRRLAGFAQGAIGKSGEGTVTGYVRLLAVDTPFQRQGIGSALLSELEKRFAARGARQVAIMDCPSNYFMPGVDFRYTAAFCLLMKMGYQRVGANHNMRCTVAPDLWPEMEQKIRKLGKEGIEIRRAEKKDTAAVMHFLERLWPSWKVEVDNALANEPPTLYLGFSKGNVVAFAGYQGNNKSMPWFGPMGTDPSLQGKGVGSLLLRLCLRDLARQGFSEAIIPWVGPVGFYARYCGAVLDRCFYSYRKTLGTVEK